MKSRRAVVAGAGIAGLTAAYRLQQAGWEVEVFDAEPRAGGRVETIVQRGYRIDTGATAFAARYPIATQLARELSLRIVDTAPNLGVYQTGQNTAVAWGNRAAANLHTHHGHRTPAQHEEFTHG